MPRARPQPDQFAVAEHAEREEEETEGHDLSPQRQASDDGGQYRDAGHAREDGHDAARVPLRSIETEDEREQVDRQRQRPEEGHGGDVLRQLIGGGEERDGAGEAERQPERDAGGPRRPRVSDIGGRRRRRRGAPWGDQRHDRGRDVARLPGKKCAADGKRREQRRPQPRLPCQVEVLLDRQRVGKERQKRSDVRQGIQAIGRVERRRTPAVPGLQQRPGRREREEGQADADEQDEEQQRRRALTALGAHDRRREQWFAGPRSHDRHRGPGGKQHGEVDARLQPRPPHASQRVRVGIASEQQHLEEHLAGRPYRWGAAEPGQQVLRDDQLHLEQQQRGEEDDQTEQHACSDLGGSSGSARGRATALRGTEAARRQKGPAARTAEPLVYHGEPTALTVRTGGGPDRPRAAPSRG